MKWHIKICLENPENLTECQFCEHEIKVKDLENHKNECIPFLCDRIVTLESEKETSEHTIEELRKEVSAEREKRNKSQKYVKELQKKMKDVENELAKKH